MAQFETHGWIDAPREAIFEYLESPDHLRETIPSCDELSVNRQLPNGGWEGEWICRWGPSERLGVTGEGDWRDAEYEPPERRVVESTGGVYGPVTYEMTATSIYELTPEDGGTRVRLVDDIEAPGPDVLTDPLVRWEFEREQAELLENLRRNVEKQ